MNMLLWLHLGLISVHIQDGSGSNETDGKCLFAAMISISCNIPMSNFVCCIDLLKVTVECLSIFELPKTRTMMFFGFSLPRKIDPREKKPAPQCLKRTKVVFVQVWLSSDSRG